MRIEYDDVIENYKSQIEKLSLWLWGNRIKEKHINLWLENFNESDNPSKEKQLALTLLNQFMFYDLREVRQALKSIFKDLYLAPYISEYRRKYNSYSMKDYTNYIETTLKKTRFLGVGNPSESSSLLLYFFRQKNNISKDYFTESCQFLIENPENNDIENLVYIDDLSGSGSQATKNLSKIIDRIRAIRKKSNTSIRISYFTLFATSDALRYLKDFEGEDNEKLFDRVDSIFELDSTYKVFSKDSRYISDKEESTFFKQLCKDNYLKKCQVEDIQTTGECGYGNTQLLLGFFYNIPNNTLPMFWSNNPPDWHPLFKRYNKKYILGI